MLGVALRLRENESATTCVLSSDQDLLFATIISPFTMPLAPFTTNSHDYLANKYWAVSPFRVGQARQVKFRLSPACRTEQQPSSGLHRDEALISAVERAPVPFRLEVRHTFQLTWQPLATAWLTEQLAIDQEALRFMPFQNGRGIVPCGFVHALRRATYAASQRARPNHG
ncbi:MAG TPA: hypothetical protein VJV79_11210 [Polyangiaceae bacterium]|nr:hypothetical protein [Polyangiaceae bacterium]